MRRLLLIVYIAAASFPLPSLAQDYAYNVTRYAKVVYDQYGAEADLIDATRADALLTQGDADGCATWKAILRAIVDIRSEAPRPGEAIY
jgi:hypothetical protein